MLGAFLGRSGKDGRPARPALAVERLEDRNIPAVTATLTAGVLNIIGDAGRDNVRVSLDPTTNQLVVRSFLIEVGRFDSAAVAAINLAGGDGQKNVLSIDPEVTQPATITGGSLADIVRNGSGVTTINTGPGIDKVLTGPGPIIANGDGGLNRFFRLKAGIDVVIPNPGDLLSFRIPNAAVVAAQPAILTPADVQQLLLRAAGASASNDAIIAIMDRGGRLLGVYVEAGVSPTILNNPQLLAFAIDGAIAKARTGAFFGNNEAPLTSRTVQNLSQTTMTQREIESYPFITDPNSTIRGPGFVAPIGIKNHFPPNIQYTPQVDLFAIEHTNRDSIISPGLNRIREAGGGDDILLPGRFNISNAAYRPDIVANGQQLMPQEAYGFLTGTDPTAQSRGIATLPGGVPIYKTNSAGMSEVVGGIGVFFPGETGFASEENSRLSDTFNPALPDRSFEAEFIAFAAVGGVTGTQFQINEIAGIPRVPNVGITLLGTGRIDLIGITLDVFGPFGNQGPFRLLEFGRTLGVGNPFAGTFRPIDAMGTLFRASTPVPDGFIVPPRDGVGITAAEVTQIILDGIAQADRTRAAIRLPFNRTVKMVFAVTDLDGNVVGLFRQPDSTIFSIDVAVAKARNVAYYANPFQLQPIDRVDNTVPGTAFTNRSFRYLALPRYPQAIDGNPPGPFSILNDGGVIPTLGVNFGPPLPASAYQSVQGFDAFNPQSNFHSPFNVANQNGIVFFPGSAPLYRASRLLIGGFGVSGDGVDQDDVVTTAGATGFEPPPGLRIDEVFTRGVRVPYNKFNRNPEGGVVT